MGAMARVSRLTSHSLGLKPLALALALALLASGHLLADLDGVFLPMNSSLL
jgi:hypothetical protein